MVRNGFSFVAQVFQLFFDGEGGGGDIGDVSDVAHGLSGDMEIMDRAGGDDDGNAGDDDDAAGDEAPDDKDESSDKKKDKKKPDDADEEEEEEEEGQEKFGEEDEQDEDADEDEQDDDKEDKDDKEEDQPHEGRPRLSDLKKQYPDIYKKFPELRDVITREYKFSQEFGTVEEAQEAAAKAKNFDFIEAGLLNGDPGEVFNQLAENSPESLKKLADNVLPQLLKQSQDLYMRATVPVIEQFLWTLREHGREHKDTNLYNSALHAAKWFFGKADIPDPSRRGNNSNEPHPAEKKLQEERQAWAQTRFAETSQEINGLIDTELDMEIAKGLALPQGTTPKQKAAFIKEIKDQIDSTLGGDEAFKRQMKALWKKAADADYPRDQRGQIKSAFLARAKALVPGIRTRLREEWFGKAPAKGNVGGKAGDKNKQDQLPKKRVIPDSGRPPQNNGPRRPPAPNKVDYSRTSDMDLIEGRFTPRRG